MTAERRSRLYTEKEIGVLIQRASEIQEREKDAPEHGFSFEDLEHIASEVGIAGVHLRAAAAELSRDSDGRRALRFWGGPFALQDKRIVEASISEEQWTSIVEGLRRITGSEGRTNQTGRSLEWTREHKDLDFLVERTGVTIRPGEARARIEIRKHYGGGAMLAYGLGIILGVGAAGVVLDGAGLSDLVNGLILASGGVGGLGAARAAIGYWTRRQRAELKKISEWLYNFLSQQETTGESEETVRMEGNHGIPIDTEQR